MSKMEYMPVDCLQVPKVLFQMEKYKNLSNTAKILYSLFLDRLKFAVQNGWVDHNGNLFVIYPKSEIKKDLNTTRYGVDQAVQELVQVGKLVRIIPNNGKANHFYINGIYENEMEEESMMTLDTIMANMPLAEREIIMDKMVKASRDIFETIADWLALVFAEIYSFAGLFASMSQQLKTVYPIAHYSEHKSTDPEQFTMEIGGKVFTEKKEAGAALLAVCKDIKAVDAAMDIGNYQGFNMRIQFDGWSKEFILSVKHEAVSKVHLGADALGNITRINNLLDSYPEKLSEAQQRLETVYEQLANAKEEVGKPFPKEEELNQKLERLSELNALLNMDEREDAEAEVSESDEKEERSARGSIHEKLQIYKEKSQRESETGKENRKRDFGLE